MVMESLMAKSAREDLGTRDLALLPFLAPKSLANCASLNIDMLMLTADVVKNFAGPAVTVAGAVFCAMEEMVSVMLAVR